MLRYLTGEYRRVLSTMKPRKAAPDRTPSTTTILAPYQSRIAVPATTSVSVIGPASDRSRAARRKVST